MTDQNHPITPSKALEHKWASMFEQHSDMEVFTEVAQWGADQELEACAEWVGSMFHGHKTWADEIRAARRPPPPSLKERIAAAITAGDERTALSLLDEALPE